jgi:hypothetical protein
MITAKTATLFVTAVALLAVGVARAKDKDQDIVPTGALADATQELERATQGRVLEIRLMDEKGEPKFEAAIARDDTVAYMRIASATDEVTEIAVSELPPWLTSYKMQNYMKLIERAKVPLAEAIQKVEAADKAPAIGGGVAKPLGTAAFAYYVETMKAGKRKLNAVDGATGALIANPEAVYEHWTPVKLLRRTAP